MGILLHSNSVYRHTHALIQCCVVVLLYSVAVIIVGSVTIVATTTTVQGDRLVPPARFSIENPSHEQLYPGSAGKHYSGFEHYGNNDLASRMRTLRFMQEKQRQMERAVAASAAASGNQAQAQGQGQGQNGAQQKVYGGKGGSMLCYFAKLLL
jgi:hypothetical protein